MHKHNFNEVQYNLETFVYKCACGATKEDKTGTTPIKVEIGLK